MVRASLSHCHPYCTRHRPHGVKKARHRSEPFIETYINCRKAERGLTTKGERWIRQTLPRFERYTNRRRISLLDVDRDIVREFLPSVNGVWNRHSHFRAIRAFYNWLEKEGYIELSPCHGLQPPKLPHKVMPRPTIEQVRQILQYIERTRDRAIVCLFVATGFRLGELANIKPEDINWQKRTVKVMGKGSRERVGKFGDTVAQCLKEHLASYSPNGNIWGLTADGIASMLKRLSRKTGVTCNPHSFRRAWTIEAIRNGTNLLDVQVLGGWASLEMVRRYARELNSEDAISRYKPLL
jgi:site-specific recombinase XerD